MTARLAELGAELLVEALALLEVGMLEEEEQDHALATFAPKLTRDLARVDWTGDASRVGCHVRAMDAVPGAWSLLGGQPLKLFRPTPVEVGAATPGTVVRADPETGFIVATGSGALRVDEVQPPGKRRMRASDWLRGRSGLEGMRLE